MTPLALETTGLLKTFGDLVAVDRIALAVPSGSFYGFLGPNGAGKSTTMKCLTGLMNPTAGTFRILGLDPIADPVGVKHKIGVVPEDQPRSFGDKLLVQCLIDLFCLHGEPPCRLNQRCAASVRR